MCSFGSSDTNQHSNSDTYGTNTPNLSPQYMSIFNAAAKQLGFDPTQWMPSTSTSSSGQSGSSGTTQPGTTSPKVTVNADGTVSTSGGQQTVGSDYKGPSVQSVAGLNPTQSSAVNWLQNSVANGPVGKQVAASNAMETGQLGNTNSKLDEVNGWNEIVGNRINDIANAAAPQSAGAPTINGQIGADFMGRYLSPYLNDVVGSTQSIYDRNTDRGLNTLRAGRDAGSAFGDRANLADGQYLSDSAQNEGNTIANLKNLGFTNAAGFGMTDAAAKQAADTQNAANTLNNNQFNANAILQQRGLANTANSEALQANAAVAANAVQQLSDTTGVSKDVLSNVMSGDKIDTDKVNQAFQDGTIGTAQLAALMAAAGQGNGYTYSQNTKSDGSSSTSSTVI